MCGCVKERVNCKARYLHTYVSCKRYSKSFAKFNGKFKYICTYVANPKGYVYGMEKYLEKYKYKIK